MHIAFNGWFWDQPHTGSGQYIRRLLPQLRRLAPDMQMTLVLPPHLSTPDDVPPDVTIITTRGGGGNLGKVLFEQRTFPQVVKQVGADIAHVPYWAPPLSSPARLVVSILDVIPLVIPDYAAGFGARLYTSLVSASARGAAHIITLSNAAKADIVKHLGVPESLVTPIYLAADEVYHPKLGAERDAAVKEKYQLPDDFILYLGGYDVRKRVNQLLLAYTYVHQAEGDAYPLVLAGREPAWGSSPVFPDMRKYAADLALTDAVHWVGHVDEADKPALYRLARTFVYPSRYEGFGLPVLEAMASGTPVIANEIPVLDELVGDGAYLVPDGDTRKMAGALLAVLGQAPLRDTLINQGLARATNFSWRKTARETLAVYEQVMRKEG